MFLKGINKKIDEINQKLEKSNIVKHLITIYGIL